MAWHVDMTSLARCCDTDPCDTKLYWSFFIRGHIYPCVLLVRVIYKVLILVTWRRIGPYDTMSYWSLWWHNVVLIIMTWYRIGPCGMMMSYWSFQVPTSASTWSSSRCPASCPSSSSTCTTAPTRSVASRTGSAWWVLVLLPDLVLLPHFQTSD